MKSMETSSMLKTVNVIVVVLVFTNLIYSQRYMECLNRGIVATNMGGGNVYLGWCMLKTDLERIAFNFFTLYRRIHLNYHT